MRFPDDVVQDMIRRASLIIGLELGRNIDYTNCIEAEKEAVTILATIYAICYLTGGGAVGLSFRLGDLNISALDNAANHGNNFNLWSFKEELMLIMLATLTNKLCRSSGIRPHSNGSFHHNENGLHYHAYQQLHFVKIIGHCSVIPCINISVPFLFIAYFSPQFPSWGFRFAIYGF